MRDNDIIIFVLIIMAIVSIFFGALGLGFHGKIESPDIDSGHSPGITQIISWAWNGMGFIFGMVLFQVDNVAPWQNFFFVILTLLIVWIILKWVRGSNQGV